MLIMKFAFRNVLDMTTPISMAPKYEYLDSTRVEIDEQEEWNEESD